MSSEMRAAAKALFQELIELDEGARRARLEAIGRADAALRVDVEAMLRADSDDFLARNAHQLAGLHDPDPEPSPVRSIDGYELIREIGRGGMGVVYEARESELGRRVALKFVLPGRLPPAESMRRFHDEMRTLARLTHPAVVPIYATGETDDGRPFFAMELILGVPLDRFVRGRRLSRPARLRLFEQACDALSHAHQNGVIHHDLKPSNMLVEERGLVEEGGFVEEGGLVEEGGRVAQESDAPDGRTKPPRLRVLDFGLARMTDDDRGLAGSVGTPTYMSPEQIEEPGAMVDIRSDIYSLGVILHELLTDELPYGDLRANPMALLSAIRAADFDPIRAAGKGMDHELVAIVGKALRRDPRDRYQSASALADDIGRYLADVPVLAVPPRASYHVRKIVRRHRTLFAAAACVLTLILVGSLCVAWRESVLASRIAAQRDVAAREARHAADVVEFLRRMLTSVGPGHGAAFRGGPIVEVGDGYDVRMHDVLDQADAALDAAPIEDRFSEAMIRQSLGLAWRTLGEYDRAEHQLELASRRFEATAPDGLEALKVAEQLASVMSSKGLFDRADELLERAISGKRERLGADHDEVRLSEKNLAVLRHHQGRIDEAEAMLDRLVTVCEEPGQELRMAELLSILSVMRRERGDLEGGLTLGRRAFEVQRERLGFAHPDTLATANNLALMLQDARRLAEAEELLLDVVAAQRETMGDDHRNTVASVGNLAFIKHLRGRSAEAEAAYTEALATQERMRREHEPASLKLLANYAMLLVSQHRDVEGAERLGEVLERQRDLLGDGHPDTLVTMANLAAVHVRVDEHDAAEALMEEALDHWTRTRSRSHPKAIHVMYFLGGLRLEQGRPCEAEAIFDEALSHVPVGGDPRDRLLLEGGRCRAMVASGCVNAGEASYRRVVAEAERLAGTAPAFRWVLARLLVRHAGVLLRQGRSGDAYERALDAYGLLTEMPSGNPFWVREAEMVLLRSYARTGEGGVVEALRELFGSGSPAPDDPAPAESPGRSTE